MKASLYTILALSLVSVLATAGDENTPKRETDNLTYCRINGVEVGLQNGHDCEEKQAPRLKQPMPIPDIEMCSGSAQIMAEIVPGSAVVSSNFQSCVVQVKIVNADDLKGAGNCPITIEEVESLGVDVGLLNDGHTCNLPENDSLSGYIQRVTEDLLVLERQSPRFE